MNLTENEIGTKAEEAIRKAEGDWTEARRIFSEQVAEDPRLHDDLMEKIVALELRQAASRLGESTKKCAFCAEIIPLDAAKCRFCGEWLDSHAHSSVPQPPARVVTGGPVIRHFTLLTGWALIVLIVILIVAFTRG